MNRTDLSSKLIHLTRASDSLSAEQRLVNILADGKLNGSSKDVRGGFKVVAFTEAPISMLASVLANAKELKMRYAPLGVMVDKNWLFERGGRPVIYQPEIEFDVLPDSKRHLHVRYEPNENTDHSWEREWRIKCEFLELDPKKTTVIVPTRDWEEKYHDMRASRRNVGALVMRGLSFDQGPRWHFIALEDLGIPFGDDEPISFESVI